MALKNLFDMVKADRYTADGREALIKAQEAETEDKVYQIGEISQKTGLQKTANGWVKPKNGAGRNHGTEQKKRGPGAIHTPGKGSVGMDKMKEAAEKGLKGQELKEFMTGAKSEPGPDRDDSPERAAYERELSRQQAQRAADDPRGFGYEEPPMEPAAENKTTIRQGPNTKTLNETPAAHIQKNLDAYKGYSDYDMEELVLEPSGYERSTGENLRGGREVITYTKKGAKDISLYFDKNGELEDVYIARGEPFDAAPSLSEIVDRVYNIGEISEKTGLQKTANGWRPVKKGTAPAKKQEKKGAGIPQATTETFVGKTYKDFVESATPSGYKPTKNSDNPDGSSTTVFEKEGKQLKVDFDKSGKITKVTPGESKPAASSGIPDFHGMESGDYDKKLRAEGWTTGGWEGNGTHASAIFKKGDRTIRVNEGQPGKITSVQEISKPAVEKFDIEKWKTGPKVEKNSKLDWSHGVVGQSIPVQGKSAEEKRNLINKYNSVGRLSRIGTKKNSYYNNKHGTFEVAGIDNDNVYIQEERSNGMGSRYMVLVTIPLNEVEEINPFHDYGKRNPDTGEESPTRPPLPEDSAPRILTGDCRIRIRKEKPALTGDTKIRVRK